MKTRRPLLLVEELEGRLVLSPSPVLNAIPTATSSNWSGYAALTNLNQPTTGSVTAVYGTWVVPSVSGTGTSYSSVWVGIDGYKSSTVEQIGTSQDIVNGRAQYYAWFEMYPAYPVTITSLTIHAGDTMNASVTYAGGNFTLSITDVTTGKSYSTVQSAPSAKRSSAEWIVEAPSSQRGVLPLANFGSATFTSAQATINGVRGNIDAPQWQAVQVTLVSSSGVKATPSGLTDSAAGSKFTVTFSGPTSTGSRPWWSMFFQTNIPTSPVSEPDPDTVVVRFIVSAGMSRLLTNPAQNQFAFFGSFPNVNQVTPPPAMHTLAMDNGFRLDAEAAEPPDLAPAPPIEWPAPISPAATTAATTADEPYQEAEPTLWPGSLDAVDRFYAVNFAPVDDHDEQPPVVAGRRGLDLVSGAGLSALMLGFYLKAPAERRPDLSSTRYKSPYA